MVGRKRTFGESKQEDLVYCMASKKEEGPPRKRHLTLLKFCFRNPFVPPRQSDSPVEQADEHALRNQTSTYDAEIRARQERKRRKERSRQIDLEALKRRRIMAQQQQMLDNDPVARERFLQAYAERLDYIKKHRSMNRIPEKLSPSYYCALYNIHKNL